MPYLIALAGDEHQRAIHQQMMQMQQMQQPALGGGNGAAFGGASLPTGTR